MTCPDIYLGPDRANAPPTPFWTNPAIDPPTTSMTEGTPYTIQVTARNNGTDDSPSTSLELYWSDPSTGFMRVPSRLIGETTLVVPGAIALPPSDGQIAHNFGWTPGNDATTTNGGHVCLLAQLNNLAAPGGACVQQGFGPDPTVDPLSAIRNIHVFAPPPPPPPPGGAGGGRKKRMAFAFAATNTRRDTAKTQLSVRHLHPTNDETNLRWLAADAMIHRELAKHNLIFAEPKSVLVAEGRERILVPRRVWDVNPKDKRALQIPANKYRLSHLGPLPPEYVDHLIAPRTKPMEFDKPQDLELLPGEMQHTMVIVEPSDEDRTAHVIEVEHTTSDGRRIGGLTLVFVPPPNWFERN